MAGFEVVVLGVGDTFTRHHQTTALLLVCDGFHLAIDCPDRYRSVLRAAAAVCTRSLDLEEIDHFLITHLHGDHVNGLEGVAFYKRFAEGKRLNLIASQDVREVIWDQRLRASMGQLWNGSEFLCLGFDDYFEYTPLSWVAETVIGPFRVRAYRTHHHIPTSAVLLEGGGALLGFSSDTAFDPRLISFLSAADVIIHEANLGPAHTPYERLLELPEGLRARMRLIHCPDELDPCVSEIPLLREGEILNVTPRARVA
jgi:ribonuclease BN (tRNA processing enzyme)